MDTHIRAKKGVRQAVVAALGLIALGSGGPVLADGTEALGPPSITISEGSGIEVAGVGIEAADGTTSNTATVNLNLSAGQTPVQVIAYWEGFFPDGTVRPNTFDLDIEGTVYTGLYIGGNVAPLGTQFATYRADITGTPLAAGLNAIDFTGFNNEPDFNGNGAGILVIYDDGSIAETSLFDGGDRAYFAAPPPEDTTTPVTFSFAPAGVDRTATLSLFFTDVRGTRSGGGFRPTTIVVSDGVNPEQAFNNILDSNDGMEWDTVVIPVNVATGSGSLTVQALSEDRVNDPSTGDPASFSWIAAGASIPVPTGGGQGCTPGYWRQPHHYADWTAPYDPTGLFSSVFEDAFPGMTLGEVVRIKGGGLNALGRHAVAALLNAASPEVDYDLSPQEVIDAFNAVYPGTKDAFNALKDEFEDFNTQGCPLNNSDGSNFSQDASSSTVAATSGDRPKKKLTKSKKKKKGKAKGKKKGKAKGKATGHTK
jgi:hypothetical protein